jgi:hypothetical protein
LYDPRAIAIDVSGKVWVAGGGVSEFSDAGVALSPVPYGYGSTAVELDAYSIAIDRLGDAWVTNYSTRSLTEFSGGGAVLSPTGGYTGGGMSGPRAVAFDGSGNVWVANTIGNNVSEFSSSGAVIPPSGYSGGGLSEPWSIAIDGSGDAWIVGESSDSVTQLSNSGSALSGTNGYSGAGLGEPESVAIDGSGNAWIGNAIGPQVSEISSEGTPRFVYVYANPELAGSAAVAIDGSGDVWIGGFASTVAEYIGTATPVITPICAGLPATPTADGSSRLGTRP